MGSSNSDYKAKVVSGDAGYVLEDVPHFSDYIPDLPVRSYYLSLNTFAFLLFLFYGWVLGSF